MNKMFKFGLFLMLLLVLSSFGFANSEQTLYNDNTDYDSDISTQASNISFNSYYISRVVVNLDDYYGSGFGTWTGKFYYDDGTTATVTQATPDTATDYEKLNANPTKKVTRFESTISDPVAGDAHQLNLTIYGYAYTEEFYIDNIIGRWFLNDTNANDLVNVTGGIKDSVYLNDGTLYGKTFNHGTNNGATPQNHTGDMAKFGGYYDFDGVNDYININNNLNNETFTLSFWINTKYLANNERIISKQIGFADNQIFFSLYKPAVGYIRTDIYGDGSTYRFDTIGWTDNVWSYYTLTYNSSKIATIYRNGILIGTKTYNINISQSNADIKIGTDHDLGQYLNGSIDEVKIWNRALTQTEIQQEMNANAVANPQGIVAYYDFNEQSGTTVYDNNHLTTGARQNTASIDDPIFSYDKATNFDGGNDYVVVNGINTSYSELSISAWIKINKYGQYSIIGDRTDTGTYGFYLNTDSTAGKIRFGYGNGTNFQIRRTTLSTAYIINEWKHIVITYNSNGSLNFYSNGVNYDSQYVSGVDGLTGVISSSIYNAHIGRYAPSSAYKMNGSIGDVRIYNRALTQDEITTLYNGLKRVNFTAEEYISNNSISSFTINSTYFNDVTTTGVIQFDVPYGELNYNIYNPLGYYNESLTTDIQSQTEVISYLSNVKLNVTASSLVDLSNISNFTIQLDNLDYSWTTGNTTTNGYIVFENLIQGNYTLTFTSDDYATKVVNVTLTDLLETYNFDVYTTNSIRFEIYDEVLGTLINVTNMTIDIVGISAVKLTTTTGYAYQDLLSPNGYEIRYYSTNVDDYKLRSVFITVDNRSTQSVLLYSLNESDPGTTTATRTFNVFNENLNSVEEATVIVARYYASSNSYVDVWQRKTDANGQAIGQFETIDAFYRYRVVYDDEIKFISSEAGTQFSTDGSTDIFINTATSLYDDYEVLDAVQYTPITFTLNPDNVSGYFTFSYSYSSVISVCLEVQESSYSTQQLNQTCVTSTGATIYFNVNAGTSTKNYLAKAKIKVTDALGYQTVDSLAYKLGEIQHPTGDIWNFNMTWLAILITIASVLIYIKKSPKIALIFQATTFVVLTALPIKFVSIPVTVGVVAFCIALLIINNMKG